MRRWLRWAAAPALGPARHHFWGSFAMVAFTAWVMSAQVGDRWGFANAELRRDVIERWGAPIAQASPSVRFVESGSVFSSLTPLGFERQQIAVRTRMSYRKRGLVYFSGFEFVFQGRYRITNPESHSIDAVFVFPVATADNRILLSNLLFEVDGVAEPLPLDTAARKLVWTGRLPPGASRQFDIRYQGQGLERFTYVMDPSLPVRGFQLTVDVEGGRSYDYSHGIVPAHEVRENADGLTLAWRFESLESGVPVGLSLPAETSFDAVIVTMAERSWATFTLFFVGLVALYRYRGTVLGLHEAYLTAATYAFFFVLLPYLAAYLPFHLAYPLSALVIGGLLLKILGTALPGTAGALVALIAAGLVVPTLAVVFPSHTGLVYALEILAGLLLAAVLIGRPRVRSLLAATGPRDAAGGAADA